MLWGHCDGTSGAQGRSPASLARAYQRVGTVCWRRRKRGSGEGHYLEGVRMRGMTLCTKEMRTRLMNVPLICIWTQPSYCFYVLGYLEIYEGTEEDGKSQ